VGSRGEWLKGRGGGWGGGGRNGRVKGRGERSWFISEAGQT